MRSLRGATVLLLTAATSWAQPAPRASVAPRAARPAGPLPRGGRIQQAVAEGVVELSRARLDAAGDMATLDLADRAESSDGIDTSPLRAEPAWTQCALDGAVQPVDLRADALTPLQVVLASDGARAVALVVMGRPAGGRRGMIYPESRWVEWDGRRVVLHPGAGVLPDAALVVDGPEIALFSYAAREGAPATARGESLPPGERVVTFSRIIAGRPNGTVRTLPGSTGLDIDTAPVRWDGGIAIVLGRDNPSATPPSRTETLFAMDHRGHILGRPRPLSDEVAGRAGGRFVDIAATPGGEDLVGAWVVRDGPRAGVWVARAIAPAEEGSSSRARRNHQRPLRVLPGDGYWGPVVGERGVLVRRERESPEGAGLADLLFTSWSRSAPSLVQRVLGSFWDAVPAWNARGLILAGLRPGGGELPDPVVAFGAGDRGRLRSFSTRDAQTFDALRDAVDIAITPVPDGAVIAWIDGQRDDDPAHRRLRLARIACRATTPAPTPAPPPRPRSAAPASPRPRAPRDAGAR